MGELGLQTHFDFFLPKGYVDDAGRLHRRGEMRLATARDEIEPLRDKRVAHNDAYLTILVLARVITRLGDITDVTPEIVEGLFAADLAYLQDFYGIANFGDQSQLIVDLPEDMDDDVEAATETEAEADSDETHEAAPLLRRASVEELVTAMEA